VSFRAPSNIEMVGFGTLVDKEACNDMEDMDCDKAGLVLHSLGFLNSSNSFVSVLEPPIFFWLYAIFGKTSKWFWHILCNRLILSGPFFGSA